MHEVRLQTARDGAGPVRSVSVDPGTTLLEAVRRAGLPIARACGGDGLCARCSVRLLEGAEAVTPESAEEADAKRRNRVDPELRLACLCRVEGPLLVTATYW